MTFYLGSFNAEQYWKDPDHASLPSFQEPQADAIVDVMDEVQFVFCQNKTDCLISSAAMNTVHKDYLHEIGFEFSNNQKDCKPAFGDGRSIFETLMEDTTGLAAIYPPAEGSSVSAFAILPHTEAFCRHYGIEQTLPSVEVVKQVNSKTFSSLLGEAYSEPYSFAVGSALELASCGKELLNSTSVVVKDPYGVSGKGNLHISTEKALKGIVSFLDRQEKKGKKVELVIEKFLEKKQDFSCHFAIAEDGTRDIRSVQEMVNRNFGFYGIRNAGHPLLEYLEDKHYFDMVDQVGKELFRHGYFGPVCLDSMVLKNDELVPVIEINARKSMGMLNWALNRSLSGFEVSGFLISVSCIITRPVSFECLFDELLKKDLLFKPDKPYGIIPLSANTFDINARLTDSYPVKGRLYLELIGDHDDDHLMSSFNEVLASLGIKNMT
jgi:hypothetical protein